MAETCIENLSVLAASKLEILFLKILKTFHRSFPTLFPKAKIKFSNSNDILWIDSRMIFNFLQLGQERKAKSLIEKWKSYADTVESFIWHYFNFNCRLYLISTETVVSPNFYNISILEGLDCYIQSLEYFCQVALIIL